MQNLPNIGTAGEQGRRPLGQVIRRRFLNRRVILFIVLLAILLSYGTYRYERLILSPADSEWPEVTIDDLLAERWYETEDGRLLTRDLARITDHRAMKLATGFYYREYKQRYAPGIKNTQYVQVGPDQYPAIHAMVVDACAALRGQNGEAIIPPSVYVGWTGKRSFEVTNFTHPSIIIGNDFLWAFKPDELRYLIARQIGHIHCRHVYLLDVTKGVRSLIDSALPEFLSRVLLGGLGGTLLDWMKEAHLSADRAGLLVTGDVDVACNALIKLNIQASLDDFYGQPNPEAFAAQANRISNDRITTASAALAELRNPNPFLTMRVADPLEFHRANVSVFKDRAIPAAEAAGFDAGVLDEEVAGAR